MTLRILQPPNQRSNGLSLIGRREYILLNLCSAQLTSFEIDCIYRLRTRICLIDFPSNLFN